MIRRKTWNSEAPSIRAASMISSGMALMAADNTTMAKPVCIQTMITIRQQVVPRLQLEPLHGFWPSPSMTPFSRPMLQPNPDGR